MESVVKHSLPKEVKGLMEQYVDGLRAIFLNEELIGVYVYGSIALGAFHPDTSDVDFVTVTRQPVSEAQKIQISELHKKLSKSMLGKRMDGMYIPLVDLGKYNEEMPQYVYCADGKINVGHWDVNAVTWWTLKNRGITVIGKEASELPFQTPWSKVVETMKYNVEQYWSGKVSRPYLFLIEEWVESAVVTMGRILYTLEHKTIVSKDEGLQYMMRSSTEKWLPLLQEVERIRHNKGKKRTISVWKRADMTKRYLLSQIEECRKKWEG
ncbi:nucleotidyltransferase domain-containing protein [Bacillus gaemokensis]|uniref:Nucleotidyltransferase n=1 Tax=Bacillus gaemokensis TaxID=574375 RepID=A0A073KD42_9BACI|nr:nucleotidyltransferase domain-containing protein [Bacillus gaemokensis]KEK25189.1 nucleotidyltransferase [Bacillus gaemokensis]KYG37367.1 nucleotidyltransferase [Bacillus gaemokensis]